MENKKELKIILPEGQFCSHNCTDGKGCIYWEPHKKDGHDRQYCNHYRSYYYPSDREGCLSYKEIRFCDTLGILVLI